MGTVWIESERQYVLGDTLFELLFFFWHIHHLDETLHRVGALLVTRDLKDVRSEYVQDFVPLSRAA